MIDQNAPLVSVVVPVFNTEAYLAQCVASIVRQTYPNIEILLVDDGSLDNCPTLCDEFAMTIPSVRVFHKENGGSSHAREFGIREAAGEYVLFVDSDDWIDPHTIEQCVAAALRDNADCVMFSYVREYPNRSATTYLFPEAFSYDADQSEIHVHSRLVGPRDTDLHAPHKVDSLSSVCMKLYRRNAVQKGRIISERIVGTSEDTIFNLYALDGCRISYIHACFYHYRKTNAQSITTAYKYALAEQWDEMYRIIREYIGQPSHKEAYLPLFHNRVACGMIGLGLNEISNPAGVLQTSRRLKQILHKPLYAASFQQLDIHRCPLKWKLFFFLCKTKAALPLAVLLKIMNYLRSHMGS